MPPSGGFFALGAGRKALLRGLPAGKPDSYFPILLSPEMGIGPSYRSAASAEYLQKISKLYGKKGAVFAPLLPCPEARSLL
jgi:hypothetical protein